MQLNSIKCIIFDFDGVIIDSMKIRDYGFMKIFENYSKDKVDQLIEYHNLNGGLSRFHKIKYFYNNILGKDITKNKVVEYANKFSEIMRGKLSSRDCLILDTVDFIENCYSHVDMHVASGSEQNELRYLCEKLDIARFFKSINGSPIHKNQLVDEIINKNQYKKSEVILIGDSINDLEAAQINNITFSGFNNESLKQYNINYIESFSNFRDDLCKGDKK